MNEFLDEEIRSGYKISRTIKKVWAVELELLSRLLEVCKEENLRVFADAGTLLGTVRNAGFIPWDDDIDVVMFREDYEKLCDVAKEKFRPPYFFQNYYTDKDYVRSHAQLRNTDTTAILLNEQDKGYRFNQGIFIDIFILDGVTKNRFLQKMQSCQLMFLKKILIKKVSKWRDICSVAGKILYFAAKPFSKKKICSMVDRVSSKYRVYNCEKVGPVNFMSDEFVSNPELRIRDKKIYEKTVWMPFEYIMIPVPSMYDSYLSGRYGDYMKPEKVSNTHGKVFFDTTRSYIEYLKE